MRLLRFHCGLNQSVFVGTSLWFEKNVPSLGVGYIVLNLAEAGSGLFVLVNRSVS